MFLNRLFYFRLNVVKGSHTHSHIGVLKKPFRIFFQFWKKIVILSVYFSVFIYFMNALFSNKQWIFRKSAVHKKKIIFAATTRTRPNKQSQHNWRDSSFHCAHSPAWTSNLQPAPSTNMQPATSVHYARTLMIDSQAHATLSSSSLRFLMLPHISIKDIFACLRAFRKLN